MIEEIFCRAMVDSLIVFIFIVGSKWLIDQIREKAK